ncbi:hypothetical protein [Amphritea sp.]|uniref:hypothetical protein n=1 Tax=Amphritea sp. TaxID=1872502 RepID=UPI003D0F6F9C
MYHNYPDIQIESRTSGTLYWSSIVGIWLFMLMPLYLYNYIVEKHSEYTVFDYLLFWDDVAKYTNFFFIVLFVLHVSVIFRVLESAVMYLFGKKVQGVYLGNVIGMDKSYSQLFLLDHKLRAGSAYVANRSGVKEPDFFYANLGRKLWLCTDIDGNLVQLGFPSMFNLFIKFFALVATSFFSFAFFYFNLNYLATGEASSLQLPAVSFMFVEDMSDFFAEFYRYVMMYIAAFCLFLVFIEKKIKKPLSQFNRKVCLSEKIIKSGSKITAKVVHLDSYQTLRKKHNHNDSLTDEYERYLHYFVELEIQSGLPNPYYCAAYIPHDQVEFYSRRKFKLVSGFANEKGFIVLDGDYRSVREF